MAAFGLLPSGARGARQGQSGYYTGHLVPGVALRIESWPKSAENCIRASRAVRAAGLSRSDRG